MCWTRYRCHPFQGLDIDVIASGILNIYYSHAEINAPIVLGDAKRKGLTVVVDVVKPSLEKTQFGVLVSCMTMPLQMISSTCTFPRIDVLARWAGRVHFTENFCVKINVSKVNINSVLLAVGGVLFPLPMRSSKLLLSRPSSSRYHDR